MTIDTHSHLNDSQFDTDRDAVIVRMRATGVSTITVGTDLVMSQKAIEIADKYSDEQYDMWATVGLHPSDSPTESFDISIFRNLALNQRVVAIGETGLDYFWGKTDEDRTRQKKLFEQHIELAREVKKPLMIHCRDAYDDLLEILDSRFKPDKNLLGDSRMGVIHFFTGTWTIAQEFLKRNFALSFPGVITFTHQYDEIVKNVPDNMFTVETDSPYV